MRLLKMAVASILWTLFIVGMLAMLREPLPPGFAATRSGGHCQ